MSQSPSLFDAAEEDFLEAAQPLAARMRRAD